MRVLSLFSGGGLGDYGLELAGMEIVGQVEIDDYCQKILKLRWPDVPKWRDIKSVTGKEIIEKCGRIDLVSGGFPCQPFSTAGKRTGETDSRHLWPHMARIIREIKPRYVLAENVPGLLSVSNGRVFGEVVRDLAESGYCVEWDCVSASALGAPHQRDRVWVIGRLQHPDTNESIFSTKQERKHEGAENNGGVGEDVAYSNQERLQRSGADNSQKRRKNARGQAGLCGHALRNPAIQRLPDWAGGAVGQPSPLTECERPSGEDLADAERIGRAKKRKPERLEGVRTKRQDNSMPSKKSGSFKADKNIREIERDFRGVAHGVSRRVDRLRGLGNAIVPQVAQVIFEAIKHQPTG